MINKTNSATLLAQLGNNIKKSRTEKGIALEMFAEHCGMEIDMLRKIENGEVNISFTTLYKLSKTLDVPIEKLTG